ncbi:MAG: extracellular solute-binding protein [Elusimicrobiaceae bacterium]|nr:extracellular solute-binding protein [Elusimicrobiaceae bacterium]
MILWVMPDSGAHTKADYQKLVERFKKEHPAADVTVEVLTRNQLWKKIFTLKYPASGEVIPDVIQIPHYWTALLTRAGVAENLSKLDPGLSLSTALAPLRAHCYKPGTKDLYSYPWWFDMSALHYRVDHLKFVTKNPEQELATWDGLLDVCARLQDYFKEVEGYYPMQNGDWRGSLSTRSTFMEIWGHGADLFTPDLRESLIHCAAFKQGVKDYINLALKDYMPILRERGSLGTMLSGKASMLLSRKQGLVSFHGRGRARVKTLPVPRTGDQSYAYLSGMNLMINVAGKDKQTALEFIKWSARADNQVKYASAMEVFPAFEDSFEQLIFTSSQRLQTYAAILASARTLPNITITGTVIEMLNKILAVSATQIVEGRFTQASLDIELDKVSKETQYLLSLYEG